MGFFSKTLTFAAASVLAAGLTLGSAQAADKKINIGWTAWSDAEAVTKLAKKVLEDRMGYKVDLTMADIGIQYQGIADRQAGRDADVLAAADPQALSGQGRPGGGRSRPHVHPRQAGLGRADLCPRIRAEEHRGPEEARGQEEAGQQDPGHRPRRRPDAGLRKGVEGVRPVRLPARLRQRSGDAVRRRSRRAP